MTKKEQDQHFKEFTERMKEILDRKGDDYSGKDRLSVFKTTAQICHTTAEMVVLDKIVTKVARLGTLFTSSKAPNNKSIEDNIVDLANYVILLYQVNKDK